MMVTNASRLGAVLLMLVIAGCSTPGKKAWQPDPNPHEKVGKPYQVQGVWYVPKAEPRYDRVGLASWYGPGFHGRLTANGEIFDENRLTAAHPTLPLPSIVEVTNPKNGRRLKLRVNDRGPFANNRILDLSKEAARRLGTQDAGVAKVRVRYVGKARIEDAIVRVGEKEKGQALYAEAQRAPLLKPEPDPYLPGEAEVILADLDVSVLDGVQLVRSQPQEYFVQVGAFSSSANAHKAASALPAGNPIALQKLDRPGGALTLVRLGPFVHSLAAQQALDDAKSRGFTDAVIVEEVVN